MNVATSPVAGGEVATSAPERRGRRIDVTPLFRIYARRRWRQLRAQDPIAAQRTELRKLLSKAKGTRFGRDHDFPRLAEVADYQRAVPLRRYDEMWEHYWKSEFPRLVDCSWPGTIPYFALTSGTTTGITKYIPCSREISSPIVARRSIWSLTTFQPAGKRAVRRAQLHAGRQHRLKKLAPGVWGGDMSGIIGRTAPAWARPFYFPPRRLEAIADWEEKIARLAPASLTADIRAFGGTPSWMLLFFEMLATLRPGAGRRLAAFYPDLELLVHGGVNFAPYRGIFAEWLKGSRAETREVYPASEGFIAVADRGDGEGLRLIVDNGLFFEFVPVEELGGTDPTRHWLANAETGINYALVLSTCAGLWSYLIGDTVRFVERNPPRILISGRTSYSLSAFGEHLIGEEIEHGVAAAASAIGVSVADFSVGAVYPATEKEPGGHLYIVEFSDGVPGPDRLAQFARVLDRTLAEINVDYREHRAKDFQMRWPVVHAVPPGTFAAWMKRRGKLGGQNKVPRVINDQVLFDDLRTFAGCG